MQHVEHSLDLQGNAYHLFQAAVLLDRMVKERTRELEQALEAVASSNRELNEAVVVGLTAQNRLRDAIDSISEGFAIFDPERPADPLQPALHGFLARTPVRRSAPASPSRS